MKILIITYSAFPRVGGRSTYIANLMGALKKFGHQVDLIAHAPGLNQIYHSNGRQVDKITIKNKVNRFLEKKLEQENIKITKWILWRESERYTFEAALREFDLSNYDIIHAQDILSARSVFRVKPAESPLVVSYHNVKTIEWRNNKEDHLKPKIELDYIKNEEYASTIGSDAIVFPCHWLKEKFEEINPLPGRVSIIPYGVNFEVKSEDNLENDAFIKEDTRFPIIVCPARLVPIKGHRYLISVLEHLKQQGVRFHCWIIGDGVLRQELENLCEQKGLKNRVRFLGNRKDVPFLLSKSDIVVLPTIHDTLPFSIMEAQLAGKPVIASRVGGIPEMIQTGETGLLTTPGDCGDLYEKLSVLLNSPDKRNEIGLKAKEFAYKNWKLENMLTKTLDLFQHLINKNKYSMNHQTNDIRSEPFDLLIPDTHILDTAGLQTINVCEPTGIIRGIIKSTNNFSNGVVHLLDISWVNLVSTRIENNGEFKFEGVPSGKYGLMVTIDDFPQKSLFVDVGDGGSSFIEISI